MSSGIRVTQEGVPVESAAEYQMILHEQFPYLEFDFVGEVSGSGGAAGANSFISLYKHNLPHIPTFFVFPIKPDGTFDRDQKGSIVATKTDIGFFLYPYMGAWTRRWMIMVVKNDLTKTIVAPKGGSVVQSTTGPQKHGIAVLREGANDDIESRDKSNFTLHTNARSFAIHMCGLKTVDASSSYNLVLNHDLGYPPTFFVARRQVEQGAANPLVGQTTQSPFVDNPAITAANSATLTIRGAQAAMEGDFVYVVLKDPVDTAS